MKRKLNSEHKATSAWFSTSALAQSIRRRILLGWPADQWYDVTIVVAVSGGADSVALLRFMDWIKRNNGLTANTERPSDGRIVVAHFDHGWRPDSPADSEFVSDLANTLGWECVLGRGSPTIDETLNEANAREARYRFLTSVATDVGARYIVTGHTANDQAETILHRIVRGTGLQGLSGIPPFRLLNEAVTIARPLLGIRREELAESLLAVQQPYRIDSTNEDEKFTRNRLRHKLLPELRTDYNPAVDAALLRLGTLAGEVQSHLTSQVMPFVDEHCELVSNAIVNLNAAALTTISPLLAREVLRYIWQTQAWPLQSMGFAEWERLEQLVHGSEREATATLPGNISVVLENGRLLLQRLK